jgi:hypothetical protein
MGQAVEEERICGVDGFKSQLASWSASRKVGAVVRNARQIAVGRTAVQRGGDAGCGMEMGGCAGCLGKAFMKG